MCLKLSPIRGTLRFGQKGKLSSRFIGSYEILSRVGDVAYRLALPPELSSVHNVFHVEKVRPRSLTCVVAQTVGDSRGRYLCGETG